MAFAIPVRIYYQDTDAAGVVFHSTNLNFMERARVEWLRSQGFEPRELARRFRLVCRRSAVTGGSDHLTPAIPPAPRPCLNR